MEKYLVTSSFVDVVFKTERSYAAKIVVHPSRDGKAPLICLDERAGIHLDGIYEIGTIVYAEVKVVV